MHPTKAFFCSLLALLLCGCFPLPQSQPKPPPAGMNVVVILLDTLNAHHLKTYGYHRDTAPFLENLSKESLVFRNNHANGGYSLVSHFSLFTGTYPPTHGMRLAWPEDKNTLNPAIPTMPELLHQAGFHTAWLGCLNSEPLGQKKGLDRGWNEQLDSGLYLFKTRSVLEWIDQHKTQKFFAFIHTYALHDPYLLFSPFLELYDPLYKGMINGNAMSMYNGSSTPAPQSIAALEFSRALFYRGANIKAPREAEHLRALYDGQIRNVDVMVEAVVEELRSAGILDRTLLIITSDHGEEFGEHGKFSHADVHNEVIDTPLIIRMPGISGRVIQADSQGVDLLPTILDLAGQPIPPGVEGKSLRPLIYGGEKEVHRFGYAERTVDQAYWEEGFKLITLNGQPTGLFNMKRDPLERENLLGKDPERARQLKNKLDAFLLSPERRR